MIYLKHDDGRFAICESKQNVLRYVQCGYTFCSHTELRKAWQQRDAADKARLFPPDTNPPPQEQAVGAPKQPMNVVYPSTYHH